MEQEAILRPIAEQLEFLRLPELSGKWVQVWFKPNFIGTLLRRHSQIVQDQLVKFLTERLPTIPPSLHQPHHFSIPIPIPAGKCPIVELDIEVWENMNINPPICVSGLLPRGRRLDSLVEHALETKLQKLVDADADTKFLLIDMPSHTDSDIAVVSVIRGLGGRFSLLPKVNEIVFARTFGFKSEGYIFFRMWNPRTQGWSDFINAQMERTASQA
jgi:hypothetical protein